MTYEISYKSKKHKEMVEDFIKNRPIVECLHQPAAACDCRCQDFYLCWVESQEKDKGLEKKARKNKNL